MFSPELSHNVMAHSCICPGLLLLTISVYDADLVIWPIGLRPLVSNIFVPLLLVLAHSTGAARVTFYLNLIRSSSGNRASPITMSLIFLNNDPCNGLV